MNWNFIAFAIVVTILLTLSAVGNFAWYSALGLAWLLTVMHAGGCLARSTAESSLDDFQERFTAFIFAVAVPPVYWWWAFKNPMKS